jgi:hypothetical protein
MRGAGLRTLSVVVIAVAVSTGLGGCIGKKKKKAATQDPVAMALKAPGARAVVLPGQRSDLTIVVPPCDQAQVRQSATAKPPPGSNQIVVPKGTLAQTVVVQPCQSKKPATGANTVLMTPGGTGSAQQSSTQQSPTQNQLVLPNKSNLTLLIVPPCTSASGASGGSSQSGGGQALPSGGKQKSVTAPPCTIPKKKPSG